MANADIKDVGRIESGCVLFMKDGNITKWDQEQIDGAFGEILKRVPKF